jgi:hypothetical protein
MAYEMTTEMKRRFFSSQTLSLSLIEEMRNFYFYLPNPFKNVKSLKTLVEYNR